MVSIRKLLYFVPLLIVISVVAFAERIGRGKPGSPGDGVGGGVKPGGILAGVETVNLRTNAGKRVRVGEPVDFSVQVNLKEPAVADGYVPINVFVNKGIEAMSKPTTINVPVGRGSRAGVWGFRLEFSNKGVYYVWAEAPYDGVKSNKVVLFVGK